jgi:hypothetical protein
VHDERVEVIGEASGGGGEAGRVELVDEGLETLLCVALVGGLVERLPVDPADALAFAFGNLREQVADAVTRTESARDQIAREPRQSSCDSRIPSITANSTRSPASVKPQATSTPSLGPSRRTARNVAYRNNAASWML